MKNSSMTTVLLVALAIFTVVSAIACGKFVWRTREVHRLQLIAAQINANSARINQLVADTVEYSKKNQAIDPILESINVKPPTPAR